MRAAPHLKKMLDGNNSVVYLNLGSTTGGFPNRFGNEVCQVFSRIFLRSCTLIQTLDLSCVNLSNEDFSCIARALVVGKYNYLETLELAKNRLVGIDCAKSIQTLITREAVSED